MSTLRLDGGLDEPPYLGFRMLSKYIEAEVSAQGLLRHWIEVVGDFAIRVYDFCHAA